MNEIKLQVQVLLVVTFGLIASVFISVFLIKFRTPVNDRRYIKEQNKDWHSWPSVREAPKFDFQGCLSFTQITRVEMLYFNFIE